MPTPFEPPDLGRYRSGSTEPWTADLLHALVRALRPRRLLELGTFLGLTTRRLAAAMDATATLVTVEQDADRARAARDAFAGIPQVRVVQAESLAFLQAETEPYDFVFVDDDHTPRHVAQELELLLNPLAPLVTPNGLILVHDVDGPFNLEGVISRFHGFVLRLPKLHVAGGLGLIQRVTS